MTTFFWNFSSIKWLSGQVKNCREPTLDVHLLLPDDLGSAFTVLTGVSGLSVDSLDSFSRFLSSAFTELTKGLSHVHLCGFDQHVDRRNSNCLPDSCSTEDEAALESSSSGHWRTLRTERWKGWETKSYIYIIYYNFIIYIYICI